MCERVHMCEPNRSVSDAPAMVAMMLAASSGQQQIHTTLTCLSPTAAIHRGRGALHGALAPCF